MGYLLAGLIISPLLNLLNVDIKSIQHVAELGVVLMLLLVGLELKPKKLWALRSKLIEPGGGQVALTALFVMTLGMLLDQNWRISLAQSNPDRKRRNKIRWRSIFFLRIVSPMQAFISLLATPEFVTNLSHNAAQALSLSGT